MPDQSDNGTIGNHNPETEAKMSTPSTEIEP